MDISNGNVRQKVWEEIQLLTERQLEELYTVVHYYRLGAIASASHANDTATEERAQALSRIVARMQSVSLVEGAPRLDREALHERR